MYSLATVVAISGARMLLHFDGTESALDIWRLSDSSDIHPVGWTEGSQLKPPLGTVFLISYMNQRHLP